MFSDPVGDRVPVGGGGGGGGAGHGAAARHLPQADPQPRDPDLCRVLQTIGGSELSEVK